MTTLFDITSIVAELCTDQHFNGIASVGNNSSLTDTVSIPSVPDNWMIGGTIWFLSGLNAGHSAVISANSLGTFTFPAQAQSCAAGDKYEVCRSTFNQGLLIRAVNQALVDMGLVINIDSTLVGVLNQIEYTLPAGVGDVRRVENGTLPSLVRNYHWTEYNGKLRFDYNFQPAALDTIAVYYKDPHPVLSLDTDIISGSIQPDYLKWCAAVYALVERENSDPKITAKLNEALQMRNAQDSSGFLDIPRDPHYSNWS